MGEVVAMAVTAKQKALVGHAFAIARERGLSRITMKEIGRRAGVTEAAVYRHFPTKDALLLRLIDHLEDLLLGTVGPLAADRSSPPAERLTAMVSHHAGLVLDTRGLPVLILAEASSSGRAVIQRRMARALGSYFTLLEQVLGELPRPAGAPAPRERALPLFGLPASLAIHSRLFSNLAFERRAAKRLVPLVVGCVVAGLRPGGKE
jgi:AcrR family transcriptional regulator